MLLVLLFCAKRVGVKIGMLSAAYSYIIYVKDIGVEFFSFIAPVAIILIVISGIFNILNLFLPQRAKNIFLIIDGYFNVTRDVFEKRSTFHMIAICIGIVTVQQVFTDLADRKDQRAETQQAIIVNAWSQITSKNSGPSTRTDALRVIQSHSKPESVAAMSINCDVPPDKLESCNTGLSFDGLEVDESTVKNLPKMRGVELINSTITGLNDKFSAEFRDMIITESKIRNSKVDIKFDIKIDDNKKSNLSVKSIGNFIITKSEIKDSVIRIGQDSPQYFYQNDVSGSVFDIHSMDKDLRLFSRNFAYADDPPIYVSRNMQIKPRVFGASSIGINGLVVFCDPDSNSDFVVDSVTLPSGKGCVEVSLEEAKRRWPSRYSAEYVMEKLKRSLYRMRSEDMDKAKITELSRTSSLQISHPKKVP